MAIKLKLTAKQIPWFLVAKIALVCGAFLFTSTTTASVVTILCLAIPRTRLFSIVPAFLGLAVLSLLSVSSTTTILIAIASVALLIHKHFEAATSQWAYFAYYLACGAALTIWLHIPQPFLNPASTVVATSIAVWFFFVIWMLQKKDNSQNMQGVNMRVYPYASAVLGAGLVWQLLQVLALTPLPPHWQLAIGFWGMMLCMYYLGVNTQDTRQEP